MSERGSFCTEYIYCPDCYKNLRESIRKNLPVQLLLETPARRGGRPLPIIAGKTMASYVNEELHIFDDLFAEHIHSAICHDVTIAVLPEAGKARCLRYEVQARRPYYLGAGDEE